MKTCNFKYLSPKTIEEVCTALSSESGDAVIIAGGQSLVPMMAMRLAEPSTLIDLARVDALSGLTGDKDSIRIGAMVTQARVLVDETVAGKMPLLRVALKHVGHDQTRSRGTVVGSIAFGEPSAEMPLVSMILDGVLSTRSARGERAYKCREFFLGPMTTQLQADEVICNLILPVWPQSPIGACFEEVAPRESDFALVSAGCQLALDSAGRCVRVAAGIGGVGEIPFLCNTEELQNKELTTAIVHDWASKVTAQLHPNTDIHASAQYRKEVAQKLLETVVCRAAAKVSIDD